MTVGLLLALLPIFLPHLVPLAGKRRDWALGGPGGREAAAASSLLAAKLVVKETGMISGLRPTNLQAG